MLSNLAASEEIFPDESEQFEGHRDNNQGSDHDQDFVPQRTSKELLRALTIEYVLLEQIHWCGLGNRQEAS